MTRTATALQAPVSSVMSWPVAMVDLTATMGDVAEALASNEIGSALVMAGEKFVGIVTERDLVTHLANSANPDHLLAEEIVTHTPVSVSPHDTVLVAARAMVEAGVRHLPVLDGDEAVGMVSIRDVTAVLLREVDEALG